MILQNLARAVRDQNYYAVFLEFVIVIAGVVIGFQINAWNEDRQDRVRESSALSRIHVEVQETLRRLDARIDQDGNRTARHRTLVDAVTTGRLDPATRDEFKLGFARLLFFSQPPLSQPAYEALQQAGDLTLIRDPDLATRLNADQAQRSWIESQRGSFRQGLSQLGLAWSGYVLHEPTPDPRRTTVRVDLDSLSSDPRAVSAVVEAARMHAIFAGYLSDYREDLARLCIELAGATGDPCAIRSSGTSP